MTYFIPHHVPPVVDILNVSEDDVWVYDLSTIVFMTELPGPQLKPGLFPFRFYVKGTLFVVPVYICIFCPETLFVNK